MYIIIGEILGIIVFFGLFTGLCIPKYRKEILKLTPDWWLLHKGTLDFSQILEDEESFTESLSERIQIGVIITMLFLMWFVVIAIVSLIKVVTYPLFIIGLVLLLVFNNKLSKK